MTRTTKRLGALLRRTAYGWVLLAAFLLFVVADAARKRLS